MPSIAQQDYIVIAPKVGRTISVDAYAIGQLAKILEKGDTSIFDVILENGATNESPAIYRDKITTIFYDPIAKNGYIISFIEKSEFLDVVIIYTSTQYEGLAAVQEAGEAQYPGSGLTDSLPIFEYNAGELAEQHIGLLITDLEGHKISNTTADGKLATVAILEETDPDGIKVPFEEIQKLIGLPIDV